MSEQPLNNKNIMGGPGLTTGGNASISDVTGQVAIGEYITQFMIKELSGEALVKLITYLEQRRKEESNQKIFNSYNPSALPYFDPRVKEFVTTNRVKELSQTLVYLQDHRLLLFTGIGGVGKTTLARALIDIRPANVPTPFWFDFRMNQSAKLGDILEKLAAYLNCPDLAIFKEEKREPDINDINKLTDKLEVRNPVWLIFDNLETILDDVYFKDENMDMFFTCLRNNAHQARIIITSRIFPKLKIGECLIDIIEGDRQDIKGLKTNFAVDYLVKNGLGDLEPDKLEELAISVDGHPLALQLLIALVKKFGVSDTLKDLTRYKNLKEDTIKKTRRLFDKLAGDERELLERISVYRQAETMDAIEIMFTDKTPIEAVDKLIDKSLLETDHKGKYWLHPLVQEFSYEDLKSKKEVHLIAYNYYKSLNFPEKPIKKEDLQPAIEAHYHACKAEKYDLAADIIWKFNLDTLLDLWGNQRTLIEIYEKLLPKDHFKDEPILKDKSTNETVLGNLGFVYINLCEYKKAIEYYEHALKIAREIGDRLGEGNHLGSLGLAYRDLGDPRKAIEYYEQALEIARKRNDRGNEGTWLESMGTAYNDLGEPKKAIEYHEQALKIVREIDYKRLEEVAFVKRGEGVVLGNLGTAYYSLGETKKAIEYYEQSLEIAREIGYKRGEGNQLKSLGLAYINLGENKKAIEYLEKSLEITRKIGLKQGEREVLGNLGLAYGNLCEYKKAIEYYEKALEIARKISDRNEEINQLGNLGYAYSDLGETKKAIECYEQALIIAKELGYKQVEEVVLGNLGLAYSDLGEPRKAIGYYEQALKIAKEIGDRNYEELWLGNLGIAYCNLGEPKKAIEYCEQVLEINLESANALYTKARVYSLMDKKNEALANLKRAVELDPNYIEWAKSEKDFEKLWEDQDFKDIIAVNQG